MDLQSKITAARQAGYSDQEIKSYLGTRSKPQPRPKPNNRKSWLSAIPSIAAAGASFIPGVGTAGAAALGGLGELGRQAMVGEGFDLRNVGKEAALSAIPGGLGKIGRSVFKGVRSGTKTSNATKTATEMAESARGPKGIPVKYVSSEARGTATKQAANKLLINPTVGEIENASSALVKKGYKVSSKVGSTTARKSVGGRSIPIRSVESEARGNATPSVVSQTVTGKSAAEVSAVTENLVKKGYKVSVKNGVIQGRKSLGGKGGRSVFEPSDKVPVTQISAKKQTIPLKSSEETSTVIPGKPRKFEQTSGSTTVALRGKRTGVPFKESEEGAAVTLQPKPQTVSTPVVEAPRGGILSRVMSRQTEPDETLISAVGGRVRGQARNITAGEKIKGMEDGIDQQTADRLNAAINKSNKGMVARTPRGQLRGVQDAKKAKGKELEELTTRFDNKLDDKAYTTIGKSLEKERSKIVNFDPTKKEHIQLNNNYAARVGGAKSIKELEEQRKYFDKEAKRILTNPDSKGTLSANLAKAYRDSIDDYVSKVNPALKTAKGEYRDLSLAEDFLGKSGTLKPQQNVGVGRLPVLPVKVAQEATGKALQAIGSNKPTARFARGLTGQVASRAIVGPAIDSPDAEAAATLPPDETALEDNSTAPGMITPETSGGSLAGLNSDVTMKALQAAALQALSRGDTQGIAAIKTVMDIVGAGKKAEKPLSAEAAKVVSNAQAGLEAIDDFELLIAEDPSAFARTGIPGTGTLDNLTGGRVGGALGTDVIDAAGDQIIDVIARLRTGAAISQAEETRFKRYIPRPGDSDQAREQKLGYLRRQFQRVAERSGAAGSDTQQLITEGAL